MASYRRSTRSVVATGDISYIRSELLCFAFDRFSAKSFSDLTETISNFYGVDAVCEAKELLWQNYSTHLSPYPKHKGKKSKDSHVTDILNAVKLIDQKFSGKPLPVEYYALRLVNLPNFTVDHMVDRMQKVEDVLQDILMSRQPADRTNPRDNAIGTPPVVGSPPSTPPAYRTPPAGAMPQTVITPINSPHLVHGPLTALPQSPCSTPQLLCILILALAMMVTFLSHYHSFAQVSQIPTDTSVVSFKDGSLSVPPHSPEMMDNHLNTPCVSPVTVFSREDTPTPSRPPSPSGAQAVKDTPQLMSELVARLNGVAGKWESKGKDPAEGSSKADGDGFKTVQNKRRHKTMLVDTRNGTTISSNRTHNLFVTRVAAEETIDTIDTYINSSSLVSLCKIDRVGRQGVKFQSFHVTIDTDNIKEILTPDFWPSGIAVRRYFI